MKFTVPTYVTVALSAVVAAFSFLPYGWAHVAAGTAGAVLMALHGGAATASTVVTKVLNKPVASPVAPVTPIQPPTPPTTPPAA